MDELDLDLPQIQTQVTRAHANSLHHYNLLNYDGSLNVRIKPRLHMLKQLQGIEGSLAILFCLCEKDLGLYQLFSLPRLEKIGIRKAAGSGETKTGEKYLSIIWLVEPEEIEVEIVEICWKMILHKLLFSRYMFCG